MKCDRTTETESEVETETETKTATKTEAERERDGRAHFDDQTECLRELTQAKWQEVHGNCSENYRPIRINKVTSALLRQLDITPRYMLESEYLKVNVCTHQSSQLTKRTCKLCNAL